MKPAQDSLLSIHRDAQDRSWDAHDVLPYWMAAVGRDLGRRSRPVFLAQKRLTVEVESQLWREELQRVTGTILARVNKLLGGSLVDRIDYKLARPERSPLGRATTAAGSEPRDEASGIQDPQLRRLYRASMKRSLL